MARRKKVYVYTIGVLGREKERDPFGLSLHGPARV